MQHLPPSFFIIGERKCATSSLYRYLIDHPQVLPCKVKEPHFFSRPAWYRTLFATRYKALFPPVGAHSVTINWMDLDENGKLCREDLLITSTGDPVITGEASANTFSQVPPSRLKAAYPFARLILSLRHPVDRAYSHYNMLKRFDQEGRRIPFRITDFRQDFMDDIKRWRNGKASYFAGISFYAERLQSWMDNFGEEQIYILTAEDLADEMKNHEIMDALCHFLSIHSYDFAEVMRDKVNIGTQMTLDPELRKECFEFYRQDIDRLGHIAGREFNWKP